MRFRRTRHSRLWRRTRTNTKSSVAPDGLDVVDQPLDDQFAQKVTFLLRVEYSSGRRENQTEMGVRTLLSRTRARVCAMRLVNVDKKVGQHHPINSCTRVAALKGR